MGQDKQSRLRGWLILSLIWLVGALCDRIWFTLDRSVPAWDQAEYLTSSLNYWHALQNPQWFSSNWWTSFWQLSSKVPPFTSIATAVIQHIFGTGPDQATLVQLFFSAILLTSVYGLGTQLFSVSVGLWAAGLCQLLPGLYRSRLDFLLDYPLTAIVALSFCCLTFIKNSNFKTSTGNASTFIFNSLAFGLSFGLALMVKQTALFFLITPIVWVGVSAVRQRAWGRLAQLLGGLLLSVLVFGFWYRTNWLFILTGGKRATLDSAIAEGDPALNTLEAWTYYWNHLPNLVSLPLLLVPIVGILLYWGRRWVEFNKHHSKSSSVIQNPQFGWLGVFLVGSYLLSSLNINKDDRYVFPYLSVISLLLAYGLTFWSNRIRWGVISLAVLLMFLNLFPIGGSLGTFLLQALSPNAQHYAYLGANFPHPQVIDQVIKTEPYLRSNIGILPSTATINQHNFNYYGALRNFQVYARQVGVQQKQVRQDARSLSWFITKTGDQGSVPKEPQSAIVQIVEQGSDFQQHQTWNLPDGSSLKLYHHRQPPIQVQPLSQLRTQVRLDQITLPKQSPPGMPVPVTYKWSGSWEQLQRGLVLLTWRNRSEINQQLNNRWLHDHSIGMGTLYPNTLPSNLSAGGFQVIEQTAMLPSSTISAGIYTLEATYLNRQTGETYPIPVPPVTLKIDPAATTTLAPELDLITQMRILAATLPKGLIALEPLFEEIGRINQYDPIQDYAVQAAEALEYRLRQEPQNLDLLYALAFSRALQQQVAPAIASLKRVVQLDAQNPYAHAYLAFLYLYTWHPQASQEALKPALKLNPHLPEIQILSGAIAFMQGNFVKAWHIFEKVKL